MEIYENKARQVVAFNGHEIEGYRYDSKVCPQCTSDVFYAVVFDAIFCPYCNVWVERHCEDPTRDYCRKRPDYPIPGGADAP